MIGGTPTGSRMPPAGLALKVKVARVWSSGRFIATPKAAGIGAAPTSTSSTSLVVVEAEVFFSNRIFLPAVLAGSV